MCNTWEKPLSGFNLLNTNQESRLMTNQKSPPALLGAYLDTAVEDDIHNALDACERMSRFFSPAQSDPINRTPLVAGIIDMNANDIGHIAGGHKGSLRGMQVERDGRVVITAVLVDEAGSPPVGEGFWLLKAYTTKRGNKRYKGIHYTGEQVFTEGMQEVLIPNLDTGIGVYITGTEWYEEAARPASGRSTRPFEWTQALCKDVNQARKVLNPYESQRTQTEMKNVNGNANTPQTTSLGSMKKADLQEQCAARELVQTGTKAQLIARIQRFDGNQTTAPAPVEVDPRVAQLEALQAQVAALSAEMNGAPAPVAAAPVKTTAPVGAAQFALKQNGQPRSPTGTHKAFCNSSDLDYDAYKDFIRVHNGPKWWDVAITDADIAAYKATNPAN
tara:strand:+ start:415 stop:1581 length:1167 start_codon:yes stop_codon:yes gene_type:complete